MVELLQSEEGLCEALANRLFSQVHVLHCGADLIVAFVTCL